MRKPQAALILTLALVPVLIFFLSVKIHSTFRFPFPAFNRLVFDVSEEFSGRTSYEKPLASEGGFRDLAGLLFGMRRLTADLACISILQYYGAHEAQGGEEESHDFAGGRYPALKKMVLRAIRLDPSLHYATLYGAGALAFNLDRPDEALEILEEGIRENPTYWRYRLYVGAIVYKRKGQFDHMTALLEDAILYPDCPTMIKSILGNIYNARKDYAKALRVWIDILESENSDAWYRAQAERHVEDLRKNLGI